jgi:hypothetical protein
MGRTYKLESGEYPSVTTILDILDKPALKQWAVNMAIEYIESQDEVTNEILQNAKTEWKNVSQDALDIGSEIHNLIEVYIKEGKDAIGEMKPEVENGFLAFLEWEKENVDKWISSEITVYDNELCVAGTCDSIAVLKDGRKVLIDFKSSKGFYDGYAEQVAIYRYLYEKMTDEKLNGIMVLRLDKETGIPESKDFSKQYENKLNAFIKLLDYWYAVKNRRCKNKRTAK